MNHSVIVWGGGRGWVFGVVLAKWITTNYIYNKNRTTNRKINSTPI